MHSTVRNLYAWPFASMTSAASLTSLITCRQPKHVSPALIGSGLSELQPTSASTTTAEMACLIWSSRRNSGTIEVPLTS